MPDVPITEVDGLADVATLVDAREDRSTLLKNSVPREDQLEDGGRPEVTIYLKIY